MPARDQGIVVEGLVRQFKDARAVDGIDLSIDPGQTVAAYADQAAASADRNAHASTRSPTSD
jgi:hypothetical protein